MDLTNILAVSGKPDLNELITRTKGGAIVKNLVNGQKFPVFASSSISQLSEIRMFTINDEKPLEEIFQNIYNLLDAKPTDFDPKKAEGTVLFELLSKVLPDYDTERVHTSDTRKLFAWYNILLNAGKLTPTEEKSESIEEAVENPVAKKPVAKESAAKKTTAPKQSVPKVSTQTKAAPKHTTTAKKAI